MFEENIPGCARDSDRRAGGGEAPVGLVRYQLKPYSYGPSRQRHLGHSKAYYVVAGALAVHYGDNTMMMHEGSALLILPGVEHRCWNPTAATAHILLIYIPGGNSEQLEQLAAEIAGGGGCG
ncbi:cupin domain-containing protein [Candidatus Gracilibacteria bacterium]|nr:cupin domain-containing protein [Candidatus Gracilibacteria bacterium]